MKKNKNGLPLVIQYCTKCNLSNQRPTSVNEYFHTNSTQHTTVEFDKNGICYGCNFVEKEFGQTIDWDEESRNYLSFVISTEKIMVSMIVLFLVLEVKIAYSHLIY